MKDTAGRNINYIRISVTDRCNLRCMYCMPEEGVQKKEHESMLSLEEIYEVTAACTKLGIDKVRITGGEPLIRKGLPTLISKMNSLRELKEITLTTNGVLLSKYAEELKAAGLSRVNISLDTLDPGKYSEITRGGDIKNVLQGIEKAKALGLLPIKINVVLIGGFNDNEIEAFGRFTYEEDVHVRFIELMPIGQAATWTKTRFIPNTAVLDKLKDLEPMSSDDPCSPARHYRLPGAKGTIGLINPISHSFCGNCNRIRLTADGMLKPCLHSNQEIDVKRILRDEREASSCIQEKLMRRIEETVMNKPMQHMLDSERSTPIDRDMFAIGG